MFQVASCSKTRLTGFVGVLRNPFTYGTNVRCWTAWAVTEVRRQRFDLPVEYETVQPFAAGVADEHAELRLDVLDNRSVHPAHRHDSCAPIPSSSRSRG